MDLGKQSHIDSDDDSDILEITHIAPKGTSANTSFTSACPSPIAQRRKSSPQMDPLPSYTTTPLHILEFQQTCRTSGTSLDDAERPVMWSPKLPSQIEPVKNESVERDNGRKEETSKHRLTRKTKTRVAHQPTKVINKLLRPRMPIGPSKRVPLPFRTKYLDVIIAEYLNTGYDETESYEKALQDETGLAARAANKNIYVNLVAGLKKKIRENANANASKKQAIKEPSHSDPQETS